MKYNTVNVKRASSLQNPAYRPALTLLLAEQMIMTMSKRAIYCNCKVANRLQLAVIARANDAGKGLGISEDASRPPWEQKYVREIMSKMRMIQISVRGFRPQ